MSKKKKKKNKEKSKIIETNIRQFSICKAVFQGGGCRGISYIGVYDEALRNGISFSEVSGTSAGAILACMVAAGASPEAMDYWLGSLDIKKIQNKSRRFKVVYWLLNTCPKTVCKLIHMKFKGAKRFIPEFLRVCARGSVYDSNKLREEIERELRNQLKIKDRDVEFRDLRIPLQVACSDLRKEDAMVFSSDLTPKASVSQAVVSSAAVPFYFSAVDDSYCDGCIVSNLPVFAIKNNGYYDKVLAFTLSSEDENAFNSSSPLSIIKKAFSTITKAGVKIQMQSVPNCYRVNIDCTGFELLDFPNLQNPEWRQKLIEKGRIAMKSFLTQNHSPITKADFYESRSEVSTYSQVSFLSESWSSKVVVSNPSTEWAWDLFPLLTKWHNEKTTVVVYCTPCESTDEDENARRRMLSHYGCEIRTVGNIELNGFFFNKGLKWKGLISKGHKELEKSRYYSIEQDDVLIDCYIERLAGRYLNSIMPVVGSGVPILLQNENENTFFNILRTIPFYSNSEFSVEEINPLCLYTMSKYVPLFKYLNTAHILRLFTKSNLDIFAPSVIHHPDGKSSLHVPPICELRNGRLFVIDGKARCYYALRNNIKSIKVIVVKNVSSRLASNKEFYLKDIVITDTNKSVRAAVDYEFDYRYVRPIEPTFHPSATYLT